MRLKLQLLDQNNQKVNVKYNETIYTDEKLAKFIINQRSIKKIT